MKKFFIFILTFCSLFALSEEEKAFFESIRQAKEKSTIQNNTLEKKSKGFRESYINRQYNQEISKQDRAFFESLKHAKDELTAQKRRELRESFVDRQYNQEKCVDKGIEIFFKKKSLHRLESFSVTIIENEISNPNTEVDISHAQFNKYFFNCVPGGTPRHFSSSRSDGVNVDYRLKEYCLQPLRKGEIIIDSSFFTELPSGFACLPQTLNILPRSEEEVRSKYESIRKHVSNNTSLSAKDKTSNRLSKLRLLEEKINTLQKKCNPDNISFGYTMEEKYQESFTKMDSVLISYQERLTYAKNQKERDEFQSTIDFIQKRKKLSYELIKIKALCEHKKIAYE